MRPRDDLDLESRSERREKIALWAAMVIGILCAGTAFVYKVAEFLFTLGSDDVQGFADVPVSVYFVVATGWLCLFAWCYVSGKFTDVESTKWEMLRQEEEYERRGE
jgi:nitrogen fixation-related uncharacterized protein